MFFKVNDQLKYSIIVSDSSTVSRNSYIKFLSKSDIAPSISTIFSGLYTKLYVFGQAENIYGSKCYIPCESDIANSLKDICITPQLSSKVPICPRLTVTPLVSGINIKVNDILNVARKSHDLQFVCHIISSICEGIGRIPGLYVNETTTPFQSRILGSHISSIIQILSLYLKSERSSNNAYQILDSMNSVLQYIKRSNDRDTINDINQLKDMMQIIRLAMESAMCGFNVRVAEIGIQSLGVLSEVVNNEVTARYVIEMMVRFVYICIKENNNNIISYLISFRFYLRM